MLPPDRLLKHRNEARQLIIQRRFGPPRLEDPLQSHDERFNEELERRLKEGVKSQPRVGRKEVGWSGDAWKVGGSLDEEEDDLEERLVEWNGERAKE